MPRRTKIIATIGPASDEPDTLWAMVAAGMDVARLSLAHGPLEETLERLRRVRAIARSEDSVVGVLADLPAPKVRAAEFPDGGVPLAPGSVIDLVPGDGADTSGPRRITVDHPSLLTDLQAGDRVALGDDAIRLEVKDVRPDRAKAEVVTGGWAHSPDVVLPPGRLTTTSPTLEDLRLLDALCEAAVDEANPAARVGDAYFRGSGTSMAAAVTSAAAAVLLADHPQAAPDDVKGALLAAADPVAGSVAGALDLAGADAARSEAGWWQQHPLAGDRSGALQRVPWSGDGQWDTSRWYTSRWYTADWSTSRWYTAQWGDPAP